MEQKKIKEFREENNIDIIKKLAKINKGYITTKQITELGLHRMFLKLMLDRNLIRKVGIGIYVEPRCMEDLYYVFNIETPLAIYSHMTALYFHGLTNLIPNSKYDITVVRNYNSNNIKKHNVFYVDKNVYKIGLTEAITPLGNKVRVYDIERCLVDIIRTRKRMDLEYIKYSIREYLKKEDKNLSKVFMYADKMGVKKEVVEFISLVS